MESSSIQKFLDAGVQFTDMTRKQAESLVKSLVQNGELRRKDAEKTVQDLVERGRDTSEKLNARIEAEVNKQVKAARARFDDLEGRVESLAEQVRSMAPSDGAAEKSPAKKSPAKKSTAKKSPAKKSTAKKSTAKKSPAKKSTAKKSTAKKSPAKKQAVGTSGVRKVSTSRST